MPPAYSSTNPLQPALVINDDPDFLEFMKLAVQEVKNCIVEVGETGVDAFQLLQSYDPDLVILDIWLKDQYSGLDILRHMRSDKVLSSIPVIVCTADHQFIEENQHVLNDLESD